MCVGSSSSECVETALLPPLAPFPLWCAPWPFDDVIEGRVILLLVFLCSAAASGPEVTVVDAAEYSP